MDIVLGVSMTPTTVRIVLVEGEMADGVTVDHDVFDITDGDGSATSSAAEQVVAAVIGTQESAITGGHRLASIGVTWSDHTEASALRDALATHGIDDVMLGRPEHFDALGFYAVRQGVGDNLVLEPVATEFVGSDVLEDVAVAERTQHAGV